jgi:hypothetical protein
MTVNNDDGHGCKNRGFEIPLARSLDRKTNTGVTPMSPLPVCRDYTGRTMLAKYSGQCPICGSKIHSGTSTIAAVPSGWVLVVGGKWAHRRCLRDVGALGDQKSTKTA